MSSAGSKRTRSFGENERLNRENYGNIVSSLECRMKGELRGTRPLFMRDQRIPESFPRLTRVNNCRGAFENPLHGGTVLVPGNDSRWLVKLDQAFNSPASLRIGSRLARQG